MSETILENSATYDALERPFREYDRVIILGASDQLQPDENPFGTFVAGAITAKDIALRAAYTTCRGTIHFIGKGLVGELGSEATMTIVAFVVPDGVPVDRLPYTAKELVFIGNSTDE